MVDLYPAKYLLDTEAASIHTSYYTSNEFVSTAPRSLSKRSVSILCSHRGSTAETVRAAQLAQDRGSSVITLTYTPGSNIDSISKYRIAYQWGEDVSVREQPMAICLSLVNELLCCTEDFAKYKYMKDGLAKIDPIVKRAVKAIQPKAKEFAKKYKDEPITYVLSSGASWAQAYSFATCSLMEMQRKHASYIHSGEYFHGAFEVTDREVLYVLLMNEGKTRSLDERVLNFLNQYAAKVEVVDARELGIGEISSDVVDYF